MMAYVDTAVWINRFEGRSAYQHRVETALRELERDGWTLCTSEAVLLEVLFKPYRDQQHALIALYQRIFTQIDVLTNYSNMLKDALAIAPK
jgi:predicted nucleic acid-binding protein